MRDIARVGLGATRDELVKSTAQVFGIARVTTGIRSRLDQAVERALTDGVLKETGGYIVAGS